jgi:hypothetical protein
MKKLIIEYVSFSNCEKIKKNKNLFFKFILSYFYSKINLRILD